MTNDKLSKKSNKKKTFYSQNAVEAIGDGKESIQEMKCDANNANDGK